MRLLLVTLCVLFAAVVVRADTDEVIRIRKILFDNVTRVNDPVLCFLGGGIGSGKSTAVRGLLPALGLIPADNRVHLGFNRILVNCDGWDAGNHCSSSKLRQHAAELQTQFFQEAVRLRYNVLFEGTMEDFTGTSGMVDLAKRFGFQVNIVGATVDTRTAVIRSVQQSRVNGRWVSLRELVDSHAQFSQSFPFYILPQATVNCTLLFDTTVPIQPHLILNGTQIIVPAQFGQFLNKQTDTEDEIKGSLSEEDLRAYSDLCGCEGLTEDDPVVCGTSPDPDDGGDGKSTSHAWKIVGIIFICLFGVLLLLLIPLAIKYSQLRREQLNSSDSYDRVHNPHSAAQTGTTYQRMNEPI